MKSKRTKLEIVHSTKEKVVIHVLDKDTSELVDEVEVHDWKTKKRR